LIEARTRIGMHARVAFTITQLASVFWIDFRGAGTAASCSIHVSMVWVRYAAGDFSYTFQAIPHPEH
jgi:hypothetical protein